MLENGQFTSHLTSEHLLKVVVAIPEILQGQASLRGITIVVDKRCAEV